ncbi:MAG: hypothetical protein JXB10_20175 [Pirellulales bacterium]|nr:hypothetical protein [Pirellulales bacterium]
MYETYLLPCSIERGGFSSERTFEIDLGPGKKLVGTAFVEYLLDREKKPLDENIPGYGAAVNGYVVCRKMRNLANNQVQVEVPSADVIEVSADSLLEKE